MPGIVGFISAANTENRRAMLDQMLSCAKHEPGQSSGTLVEPGVAVGWVCHKGSYSDCLPIWNRTKDICLVFSGEHFAGSADLERIRRQGYDCPEDSAAWLVQLYEEAGEKFFEKLNGAFSGLLVDRRAGKIVLFNDRYGLHRIYCHENAGGFYFASEAKSLLKVFPELRRLDLASLGEFFSCGCVLQNRSLFSGIHLLPGGSAWTFEPGQAVQRKSYFSRESWEQQAALSPAAYYEKMSETFTRILPGYFRGRQPVTLSLTGGLDSRMILACASPAPAALPCHTFGGMYRECADVRLARQIAQVCGQRHEVIPVTSKFFSEFPTLAQRSVYYSDGTMDVTGAVELFGNRAARQMAPVRLTGNYGSEVLRGNVAFKTHPLSRSLFDGTFVPHLDGAAATYASERRSVSRPTFIAFKQVPWFHYARLSVEQSQLTVRSPYLDNELVAVAYQAPADDSANKAAAHRYIADHNAALAAIPTDRGVMSRNGASNGKWSAFYRELMPRAEYVYDYGMPQWLAKIDRWMTPLHVERLFLGRQKFYHFRVWYRNELSRYVKDVLLDPRALGRPYLNRKGVEEIVTAHVEGRGNYTLEIHKLLTHELLHRQLIEQEPVVQ